jgi:hypothetical protein
MEDDNLKKLLVTLTPAEGKRLIAKGLLATEAIQNALNHGYLCITLGTTSSYLVEEILGEYDKTRHIAGVVVPKGLSVVKGEMRHSDAIFHKGEYIAGKKVVDILEDLGPGDVIVKCPNALDANMIPLVLLGHPTGGSMGSFMGAVASRNITLVMPAGFEKCIPVPYDVMIGQFGKDEWDYSFGMGVGIIPVPSGIPFTEGDALDVLFNVWAVPIAAGGVNGAEGAVTLFVEGEADNIKEAYEFLLDLKGEPPFPIIEHVL